MTLMLATHRRLIVQDQLVRDGRWSEGRPMLSQIPRLRGMTLGLIAFGHVARAVAERAKPFGLHIVASGFCPNCGVALTAAPMAVKRARKPRADSTAKGSVRD